MSALSDFKTESRVEFDNGIGGKIGPIAPPGGGLDRVGSLQV